MLTKSDLNEIDLIVSKRIHTETKGIIKEELKSIKEDVSQTRKDIKTIINFFDREYLELRKRVERIESHLNLPTLS